MAKQPAPLPLPSDDEIDKAISQAIILVREEWFPGYTFDLETDWDELGLITFEDRTDAIEKALGEVCVAAYDDPPSRSAAEQSCRGARVLQFVWQSVHFGCEMFFRFAIHRGYLFVISLHRAKFAKKPVSR
jgi:hypothetical protein